MAEDKKKNKNNVRFLNLSSYQTPQIKEEYNDDYVCFGEDNDYFDRVCDLYLNSPTNATCINGISDMIFGRGLDSLNSNEFPEDYVKMKKLLRPAEIKKLIKAIIDLALIKQSLK